MSDFREEAHPRDESGKFIETGGEKLKAWGKTRGGKLKDFKPGVSAGEDIYHGSGAEAFKGKFEPWKSEEEARRWLKSHKDDEYRLTGRLYPRTKLPQPKGGTDVIAPPGARLSKSGPFGMMKGDEKEVQRLMKSELMGKLQKNIDTQGGYKKELDDLRGKMKALDDRLVAISDEKTDIVNDDSHFLQKPTQIEKANLTLPGRDTFQGRLLAPEWQKKYESLKDEEAEKNQRYLEFRDQQKLLKNKLGDSQRQNALLVTKALEDQKPGLGRTHEEATKDWIANVTMGKALQMQRVANEMGFKWQAKDEGEKGRIEESLRPAGYGEPKVVGQIERRVLREYMSAQYNISQASLRASGYKPGDKITLYRGMSLSDRDYRQIEKKREAAGAKAGAAFEKEWTATHVDPKDPVQAASHDNLKYIAVSQAKEDVDFGRLHIAQRPLTSWTDKPEIAEGFPGVFLLKAEVPIERIFSNYRLFKNTYDENEYVVLGATDVPTKLLKRKKNS